jgi:hypothetical protein
MVSETLLPYPTAPTKTLNSHLLDVPTSIIADDKSDKFT